MLLSFRAVAFVATTLASLPSAWAGFKLASDKNIAVYWGQNSFNQGAGSLAQQRLSYYCANTDVDIIPLAFMNGISPPITNFANAGDNCTAFPDDHNVLSCPQLEADIKQCQFANGKTIVLSLGGATYTQGGWSSVSEAQNAAQLVWDMFGPIPSGKSINRPFGSAVVDGFDFDFEATTNNLPAFGAKLRSLMDAAGGKKFYLTSAPQCVFPDAANGPTLNAVAFDFVMIQFYNNWCGVSNFQPGATTQNAFNLDVWDDWAKHTSPNKNVKLLLGIPAASGAGGGYTNGAKLKAVISYSQQFSSFGGVMMWDMSQLYGNTGFLAEAVSNLAGGPPATFPSPIATTTSAILSSTSISDSRPSPSGTLVPQWGQCGGQGYTGSTQCQSPYQCVSSGQWWASCR